MKDAQPEITTAQWTDNYLATRPRYAEFCRKLQELIGIIIRGAEVDVVQIEGRAKDVQSFSEKIRRKGGKYADPMSEITDLAGLRVITYYIEDVDRIVSLLRQEFQVIEEHSTDKKEELKEDQFGYTSFHLIIELGESRRHLAEWKEFSGLKAEVQIRTALQHAWAAVNHKLDYKKLEDSPRILRRRLFRLSALFELADEEFSNIRKERKRLSREYVRDVESGDYDIDVDASSIAAWLSRDPLVREFAKIVESAGWSIGDDQLPTAVHARDIRDLLTISQGLAMNKIDDIRNALSLPKKKIAQIVASDHLDAEDPTDPTSGTTEEAIGIFLMGTHGAPKELYAKIYDDENYPKFTAWRKEVETILASI